MRTVPIYTRRMGHLIIAVVCAVCIGTLSAEWTQWYERDDPTSNGDLEDIESFKNDGVNICEGKFVAGVECKRISNGHIFNEATAHLMPNIFKTPCTVDGLVCLNQDNSEASKPACEHYAVRFNCVACTKTGWLDRDDQSYSGDWESLSEFEQRDGHHICPNKCIKSVECRQKNTEKVFTSATASLMPNIFLYPCTVTDGLACLNSDNVVVGKPRCHDYEINFCCA